MSLVAGSDVAARDDGNRSRVLDPPRWINPPTAEAGGESGDKLWRMPLAEPFDRLIDSPIADMKNVGPREGGSITAAQFIQRFVENGVKWAHIDMAGKAWSDKASVTYDKGATGFGVRLLDQYVEDVLEA